MFWNRRQDPRPEDNPPVPSPQPDDRRVEDVIWVDEPRPEPQPKRKGHFLRGMIFALVLILSCWIGFKFWGNSKPVKSVNIGIIRSAIENCGEMTTLRSYFEAVADHNEDASFGRWRKFAVIFRGTVDCGFDMRRARIEVFEDKKEAKVNLPHCEIQRVWVNLESGDKGGIKVYDQQGGWFSHVFTIEEQNAIISDSLKNIRQRAYDEWDIVRHAEDNAAKLYKSFLAPFNYDVSVIFTDDESKLGIPEDSRADTMKGGGALIVHTAE